MKTSGPIGLIASALTTALLLLALSTLVKARQVWVWKATILATEYGHWLALAALATAGLFLLSKAGGAARWQVVALAASMALFARPSVLAFANESRWMGQLNGAFGVREGRPLISFRQLWRSAPEFSIQPERIEFARRPSGNLSLDFYRVKAASAPWVVVVHGGGWDSGDPSQFRRFNEHLVERGYAVAAVTYRFAPDWKWPSQKEDVLAAAGYLKAHAGELNIDPNRWAILGRSAGGQIAEAVAYQSNDPSLKGVVAFYSPADLDFAYRMAQPKDIINSRELVTNYIGGDPDRMPEAYKDASPIFFAGRDSTPTLLLHGRQDPLTWHVQSRRLSDRMSAAGGKVAYLEFPWATHAFDFNTNGPAGQVSAAAVELFLDAVLRG